MNPLIRFVLLGFFLMVLLSSVFSQPNRLQFRHLTPDEGLSSSTVTCFLKDHKGFMWIGTYYGLNRYDGYQFTVYNNNFADSTSLANNFIYDIFEDHQKNLWISTQNGLSLFDSRKDQFVNFMQIRSSPLSAYKYNVLNVQEDSLGNLWLATNMGLIYFDRIINKAVLFTHDPQNPQSISNNVIEKVFIDSKNRVWISTRSGLNLFQPEKKTFLHIPVDTNRSNGLRNTYFTNIVEDKEGNLWFGTFGSGLYRLDSKTTGFHKLISYRNQPNDNRSLSADRILSLFVDHHDDLWVGVENGGLNLYDKKTDKFWCYHSNELDPNSLNNESIHAIYKDDLGNLWVGTFAGGINISKFNSGAILEYKNFPGAPASLSNNSVTCFMEDHLGRIWIGTDGGGFNIFNSKTDKFDRFNSQNTNLKSDAVLSIIEDSDRQIWIGTWGGGLNKFNLNTRSVQSFTTKNSAIPDDNILSIIEDEKGDLWLSSFQNGLIHYNKKNNIFESFTTRNSNISFSMTTVVKQMPDKGIMIGTPDGFNVFYPDKKYFRSYFHIQGDVHSLSSDGIHCFEVENDTSVWIGTDNGLNRFNPKKESFTQFFKVDGLPDNAIKGLVMDLSGKLWIGTNKGVCRWDLKNNIFKNFTKADGLQSNEFNDRSALQLKDGRLLLGGTKGFNVLYPDKIRENKNVPPVLLTDFFVFNRLLGVSTKDSPLKMHISEVNKMILSYSESVITFQFAAIDFTATEKNQYAYIMEGFDIDWNYVGTKRTATYTNLDPGNYVFRVKGSNSDGIWNEKGTSIEIKITPPFYKTVWFRVGGIILLIGIILLGYRIRTARIRAHNRELEKHVSERTSQMEMANRELEAFTYSVSHDLRAPLRAIDGYTNILMEDYNPKLDEEGNRVCAIIRNETKRMGKLIDDLLSFSHIGRTEIQVSSIDMGVLVHSVFHELTTPEVRERIEFNVASLPPAFGDPTLIHQVWTNLISNAIKFSSKRERAVIEIGYRQDGQKTIYSIRDNGFGFDMKYADKLFGVFQRLHNYKEFEGTGVGLAIVQRLINCHGGRVWAESQVDKGATFYFTMTK